MGEEFKDTIFHLIIYTERKDKEKIKRAIISLVHPTFLFSFAQENANWKCK